MEALPIRLVGPALVCHGRVMHLQAVHCDVAQLRVHTVDCQGAEPKVRIARQQLVPLVSRGFAWLDPQQRVEDQRAGTILSHIS